MSITTGTDVLNNEISLESGGLSIQLSALDNNDRNILSVLAKRTYRLLENGNCVAAETALPLRTDFEFSETDAECLLADTDIYSNKPFTDLVVKGHVYANGKDRQTQIKIDVSGQRQKFELPVFGDRKAYKSPAGKILFTDPQPIDKIPLEYYYAYGGADLVAEAEEFELPDPDLQAAIPEFDWNMSSPYRYQRNPIGKGYIVKDNVKAFENLELPNFEDPFQRLTPGNLICGHPDRWIYQAIPKATTWVNPSWFPRIAYFGFLPAFDKNAKLQALPEHLQGLVEYDILEEKHFADKINTRGANGASAGLQFPFLNGNESIRLLNLHQKIKEFTIQLPFERPRIWVDGRKGKLLETRPVIQTILIEPDENRLSIVWRGSAPALRPYLDEELKKMPYKVEW